ncbi:MAG: hypothetical protein PHR68_03170 [Candidatus Gracilibacteria bacterium]|nr:hypothetical protein [Candidatus Gracilibacteria bacterium]
MQEEYNISQIIDKIDIKGDGITDGINENNIKNIAKQYLKDRIKDGISDENYEKLLIDIKILLERQDIQKLNLKEELEKQKENVVLETGKNIENEKKTQILQNMIYKELKINGNLETNTDSKKFVKGIVDGLILNNIELVENLLSKGIDEIIIMLKNLLNPDVIIEIIKDLASSFGDMLDTFKKPYEGGVAIGGMGLGIFGKGMKGLKVTSKISDIAIDFNKIDFLESKGTYLLDSKKLLKPIEAKKRIEEISKAIDIKYLVNHPGRIDSMLDIVESMCKYITKNSSDILKLSSKELNEFKSEFITLRKEIIELSKNELLDIKTTKMLENLIENNFKETYYILFPKK